MTPPPPLRHRVEYLGFRVFRGLLSVIPSSVALGLGEALGWVIGVVLRVRRRVVDENLARAFPNESEAWRRRVAVASYQHLGREAVMTVRLSRATAEQIRAMTEVQGLVGLEAALASGKGLILVTGHLGNWEVAGAAMAVRGFPLDAVAHGQRNLRFGEELRQTRGRLGMTVISRESAPRRVPASLRQGRAVGLVADQNVAGAGIFVDFFGLPASTARGPAVFALRTGAPIWVGGCIRVQRNPPRYRLEVMPVEVARTGRPDSELHRLTQAIAAAIEHRVREAPEQYFWVHKRWKRSPPDSLLDRPVAAQSPPPASTD